MRARLLRAPAQIRQERIELERSHRPDARIWFVFRNEERQRTAPLAPRREKQLPEDAPSNRRARRRAERRAARGAARAARESGKSNG